MLTKLAIMTLAISLPVLILQVLVQIATARP